MLCENISFDNINNKKKINNWESFVAALKLSWKAPRNSTPNKNYKKMRANFYLAYNEPINKNIKLKRNTNRHDALKKIMNSRLIHILTLYTRKNLNLKFLVLLFGHR